MLYERVAEQHKTFVMSMKYAALQPNLNKGA